MPTPGWTDVLLGVHSGAQDYWLIAEGPEITAADEITVTQGLHNIVPPESGPVPPITQINGGVRNGQFVVFRIGGEGISFGPGGNTSFASGTRAAGRWMKALYRDGVWEEQALTAGDFASGVVSFNARTGEVVPVAGDYGADDVTATDPTGSGGTDVQAVLDNLDAKIDTVAIGDYVETFNARTGTVVPVSGDYPSTLVPITPFTEGEVDILGPSLQDALVQIMAAIGGVAPGGVLSFAARTGNVVPILGDYTATIVGATDPTGLGGSTTQAVLNNLKSLIDSLSSGTGVLQISTPGQTFNSASPGWPNMTMGEDDFNSEVSVSAAISAFGIVANGLSAGSIHEQITALAWRTGANIPYAPGSQSIQTKIDNLETAVANRALLVGDNIFTGGNSFTGAVEMTHYVRLNVAGDGLYINGDVYFGDGSGGPASILINSASSFEVDCLASLDGGCAVNGGNLNVDGGNGINVGQIGVPGTVNLMNGSNLIVSGDVNFVHVEDWGINSSVGATSVSDFACPAVAGFSPLGHHLTSSSGTYQLIYGLGGDGIRVSNLSGGAQTATASVRTIYVKDTAL